MIMNNREERNRGLIMLRLFIRKQQRALSRLAYRVPDLCDAELDEDEEVSELVPDDVEEGHFAVVAVEGGEPKRFIVELGYLTDPAFLRLLKEAEEEYGFQQKGVLAVPCQPEQLQKILEDRRKKSAETEVWVTSKFCNAAII